MDEACAQTARQRTVTALRDQIRVCERGAARGATAVQSCGCDDLDDLLPERGVRLGTLVEWLGIGDASGANTLSLLVGRQVCPAGRPVVLIDPQHALSPLSLGVFGFDFSQLVMVRPGCEQEALWACEEALRCAGVGLVWANIERFSHTSFRRLQLAAEQAQGVGFLVRSERVAHQPSWADARLLVRPFPSGKGSPGFRVEVASSHGRPRRSSVDILLDSLGGTMHAVSSASPAGPLPVVS